jgi:undecaprenyl-phosphate galactose phosphotransferase
VSRLHRRFETVTVVPDLGTLPFAWGTAHFLFDRHRILLTSRNRFKDPFNRVTKRTLDLLASVLLLVLALPVLAVIALVIRCTSRGPAFLMQERLGRGGRRFKCLKFRTMFVDADERLETLLQDPTLRQEWETYRKLRQDPRVTGFGKFLRSTSLDELPQLLNVVLGDMSLVGPRPYLPREHQAMGEEAETILTTWPGITGLGQVSGRREISFSGRVWLESWYVRNWSVWLDLTILLRTFPAVLRRRGAH